MATWEKRVIVVACCIGFLIGAIAAKGDGVALAMVMAAVGVLFAAPIGGACVLLARMLRPAPADAAEASRPRHFADDLNGGEPPAHEDEGSRLDREWYPANPDRVHAAVDLPPVHRQR